MNNFTIREATVADLSRLRDLEQKIIDSERPYDASIRENNVSYYDLEKLISDSRSYLVVVDAGAEIVGSGYAQIKPSLSHCSHDNHCYLGFIYLEPECRGKALGQGIIDELKAWGVNQGMQYFQLNVYSENAGAIRAYEKAGFAKLAVRMELVL